MNHKKAGNMLGCLMLTLVLIQGLGLPAGASGYESGQKSPPLDWESVDALDLKMAQRFATADNPSIQATEIRIKMDLSAGTGCARLKMLRTR